MDKIKKSFIELIIVIVFFISFIIGLKYCKKPIKESNTIYSHLEDTIKKYKNKNGELVSSISLLQASNVNTLLEIKSKDKTIQWLQSEVLLNKDKIKNGGSVSVVGTEVIFTGTNGTVINSNPSKPIKIGDTLYVFPEYLSFSKDSTWIKYKIVANKDSTNLDLKVTNKYSVIIGEKRDKWYSKKYPVVEVTNKNPYDNIKTLRAFEVKNNQKTRLGLGLSAGWGVSPKSIQPYIGVGINYTLIKF